MGNAMEEPLRVELDELLPLRDVVFNALRKAILTGRFKPGERLMEIHLADQLGVSRTPIRDAIRKLELEGLVVMIPRRGATVAELTVKSMQDVLEVRRSLDVLSVELACERITEEGLAKLKLACEEFAQATQTGNPTIMARTDVALHDVIVAAAGNRRLKQMIDHLAEQIYRYRFVYLQDDTRHDMLIEEHNAIYNGIMTRQKDAAVHAATVHIDNQEKAIIGHIEAEKKKML